VAELGEAIGGAQAGRAGTEYDDLIVHGVVTSSMSRFPGGAALGC
jgi:hypothetical protein